MATDQTPTAIDLSSFSQMELLLLSRCSPSSLDQRDVLIPEIDRSIFNESAATRRQTYSKERLFINRKKKRAKKAQVREVGLENSDSDLEENRLIVGLLKDLIQTSTLHDTAENERIKWSNDTIVDCEGGGGGVKTKRKRGRKAVNMAVDEEIVNINGVVVDLIVLENAADPYGEELKRRTIGLVSEEDCLGFLRGLDGKWGSTRRKRRIADASSFGDYLPIKWKLLLALRRREGRIWIYCRRYISPGGQEFLSCKEVALYLKSLFGNSIDALVDVNMDNIQNFSGTLFIEDSLGNSNFPVSALPKSSVHEQGREMALESIEKLVDVQVSSIFECQLCKLIFHEKKYYLQHVLSCHEKTTKRYRFGSRERSGVILDHGQFECQFCYKIFLEKDSYYSHVGAHIRGSNNESLGRTCVILDAELATLSNGLIKRLTKTVDGLDINFSNHCLDDCTTSNNNDRGDSFTPMKANVPASRDEILNLVTENQYTQNDPETKLNFVGNNSLVPDIYSESSSFACPIDSTISFPDDFTQTDELQIKVLESHREVPGDKCENTSPSGVTDSEDSLSVGKELNYKGQNDELEQNTISSRDFGKSGTMVQPSGHLNYFNSTTCKGKEFSCFCKKLETAGELEYNVQTVHEFGTNTDTHMKENLERSVMTSGEIILSEYTVKSTLLVQPADHTTESSSTQCEGAELPTFGQMPKNAAELGELKRDDIQTPKISFPTKEEESVPFSSDIAEDFEVNDIDANRLEGEGALCSIECRLQITAVCVWCNSEFIYEVVNSALLADSVGYMCTKCREKISAQFSASTMVRP